MEKANQIDKEFIKQTSKCLAVPEGGLTQETVQQMVANIGELFGLLDSWCQVDLQKTTQIVKEQDL
jgi:hypothetical protein